MFRKVNICFYLNTDTTIGQLNIKLVV